KRIHATAARHAAADPDVEILTTHHLRLHTLLLRAFEDRAFEALHGVPAMSCDLCKYRVRLIGREDDLGLPQTGHHHHVRARDHDDDHDHPPRPTRRRAAPLRDAADHPWDERLLERLEVSSG